jgi:hypothetical protein
LKTQHDFGTIQTAHEADMALSAAAFLKPWGTAAGVHRMARADLDAEVDDDRRCA